MAEGVDVLSPRDNLNVTFDVPSTPRNNATTLRSTANFGRNETIPASSLWREALSLRGFNKEYPPTIRISSLQSDDQQKDSTCMVVHNKFNHIATGSRRSDTVQIIRAKAATSGGQETTEFVTSTVDVPTEVHCIDWHNNNMLVGGPDGKVSLVRAEATNSGVIEGDITTYSHEMKTHPSANTPSPEQYTFSSRMNCVKLNRFETSKLFLSVENHRLHVWDIEKTKAPVHTVRGSNTPLYAACWNLHQETVVMLGGASRSLKLIDLREMRGGQSAIVAWRREEAHSDSIRDIQWNPMIPHWVASAGNDGVVNIWDLRYNSEPMIHLEGHDNIVRTVSWSRYHCELLASGGIDHQVKIWSMKVQPHHILSTIGSKTFSDTVVGVDFSFIKPLQCFALSGCGEVTSISLTPKFLEPLVFSRFKEGDELAERDVEKLIFYRNFPMAFRNAIEMAKKYKEQNKLDKALRLLELCKEKSLNKSTKKTFNPNVFKKELDDYSYYIPPNLESVKKVDERLRKGVDNLILNCQILRFTQRNDFQAVNLLETKLLELMRQDVSCIEIDTIKDVILLYQSHDYKKAMSLVISLGHIFQLKNEFAKFDPIAKLILSPTIFEVSTNTNLQESAYRTLQKILSNSDNIISQIVLQRDVISALWETDSSHKIVNLVEYTELRGSSGTQPTYIEAISQSVIRTYLNSLLCLNRMDRFFTVTADILQHTQGYDFSATVKELGQNVAMDKLKAMLNDKLYSNEAMNSAAKKGNLYKGNISETDVIEFLLGEDDSDDEEESTEDRGIVSVIVSVLNIVLCCAQIPDYALPIITAAVDTIQMNITFCLNKLTKSDNGTENGVVFASNVMKKLSRGRVKDTEEKDTPVQAKAKQIKTFLSNFLDKYE
ncbi:tssc1 [Acrasis kona]|uniref:Tssc1 n=1 Tax=Acrasis kona TaxID=1008807 RepID=A0AAW2YK77_9EUKA